MGSRWCAWCLAAVAGLSSQAAFAEDIGREPLAPMPQPAPAAEAAKPAGGASTIGRPAAVDRPRQEGPRRRWYGWQPLIVDGIVLVGLVGVAANQRHSDNDNYLIPFAAVYILDGPVIHAAHGHVGKAALSLGIRSLGPLMIALAASQRHDDVGNDTNGSVALAALGVLAIPTAIAVDAAAIAREDVNAGEASILRRVAAAPWVDPKRGAAGLAASFAF